MDDLAWDDLRLFLAVAEAGSFTRAARALGLGQPTVTRRLADLEFRLGGALFRRSVAGAALTDLGERMLEPARRMAEWAGEARRQLDAGRSGPSGWVRVTAPPSFAAHLLAPLAGRLHLDGSALRMEVSAAVHYADIGRGEAELAIRGRAAESADLVTIRSWEYDVAVFVAPALAARLGPSPRAADLPYVAWAPPYDAVPPNPQLRAMLPGFVPSFTADDFLVQMAAACAGAGAVVLGRVKLTQGLGLVPVELPLGPYARTAAHLVCARSALAIPRVRAMSDLLVMAMDDALRPWVSP